MSNSAKISVLLWNVSTVRKMYSARVIPLISTRNTFKKVVRDFYRYEG